jgi:hypothetical protein
MATTNSKKIEKDTAEASQKSIIAAKKTGKIVEKRFPAAAPKKPVKKTSKK